MWLSEGGTWLAYLKLNDSLLSSVSLPSLDQDRQEELRYPKSEGNIPTVELLVVNLKTRKAITVNPPPILSNSTFYVIEVKWISEDILFTSWMARGQNVIVQTISQAG